VTLAWWALRERKWFAAGVSIGLVCAIKPNFLVWPGLLLAGRSKKTGFTAIATTAMVSAIPLILQGPTLFRQWIAACRRFNGFELPGNSSLLAIFSRAGIPKAGLSITVLMLIAATVWVAITKPESLYASEIGILASLFAGPISWLGYTILLIPAIYGRSMDTLTRVGCVLLCIPWWVAATMALNSRIAYVLFSAPSFYGLTLIAISAVYRGVYAKSECRACPPAAGPGATQPYRRLEPA
jgi:hypothetical protein